MRVPLARTYLAYERRFPIRRGKDRIAKLLTCAIGSVPLKAKCGPVLETLLDSQQDRALLRVDSSDRVLRELSGLRSNGVFVDIGANTGLYSLLASRQLGPDGIVLCFEPSFREYRRLLQNIAINRARAVIPFNFALTNSSEIIELAVASGHTGLNSIQKSSRFEYASQPCPSFSFDLIWRSLFGDRAIDLVKLDVEGAEFKVLEGMKDTLSRALIKKLVVEITPGFLKSFGSDKESLYGLMEKLGYSPSYADDSWQYDEVFAHKSCR
ncbi:MAG: FkbM family methyltransferase [Myxococcota bacterium]